jgi:hypothetical protein
MDTPMTVEFQTSVDDVIAFSCYHRKHTPKLKRSRSLARFGLPFVSLLVILFEITQYPIDDVLLAAISPWLLLAILWIPAFPLVERWGIKRQAKALYKAGPDKNIFGSYTVTLSPECILRSSDFGDIRTRWDGVERIERSGELIFIYNGSSSAYIIPRRAFDSDESMTSFFNAAISFKQEFVAQPTAGN